MSQFPSYPPRRNNWWFVLLLIVIVLGIAVLDRPSPNLARLFNRGPEPTDPTTPPVQPAELVVSIDPGTIGNLEVDYETAVLMDIYDRGNPSVVNIYVMDLASNSGWIFAQQGQGSGFVWDREGHIVTNAHVVHGADTIGVRFYDGTVSIGQVIGQDPDSDLAVIRIDAEGYDLQPVQLGRIEDLKVGMRVAAIGSPFSQEQTMTSGIVSALGRTMSSFNQRYKIPDSIQFDAAINPGNSGGPLFNDKGEVVGVVSQIISPERSFSGIGLAVPVSIFSRVVPSLIATGQYEHSYLGITGKDYSPVCSEELGLSKDLRGVYIIRVLSSGPAARAGLQGGRNRIQYQNQYLNTICPEVQDGDLITAIEGTAVSTFGNLMMYLERYTSPGDQVTLTILRDGQYYDLDIVLGARPS